MFTRSSRRASAFAAAIVLTVGLSACSSDSADDAQQPTTAEESPTPAETAEGETVAEACAMFNDTISPEIEALGVGLAGLQDDDHDAAIAVMDVFVTALKDGEDQVTNTEVKAAASDMRVVYDELLDLMSDLNLDDLDVTNEKAVEQYQAEASKVQEVKQKAQTAGTAFDELCSTP